MSSEAPNFSYPLESNTSDEYFEDEMEEIDAMIHEQELLIAKLNNDNNMLTHYMMQQIAEPTRGGSVHGLAVVRRDRVAVARNIFNNYFSVNPTYDEEKFKQRYRMSRNLFVCIVDYVKRHDRYFKQRTDAVGKKSLSSLQKITAAFRILAYDIPADATDEYIKIEESTALECLKRYCHAIVELYGAQYLRSSTSADVSRLLHIGQECGFLGMLGSLDCMHWKWKNCPTRWLGQYTGRSGIPTIILEIVADYDLCIWHAHFGIRGSNNDINVLKSSHLFVNLANGIARPAHYIIRGNAYETRYYLADGIYPKWSTLVQTIHDPRGPKNKYFTMKQELCRKDVERAFGVLHEKFAIAANPAHLWSKTDLHDIMVAYIIMHNKIIEDERGLSAAIGHFMDTPTPTVEMSGTEHVRFQAFLERYRRIKNKNAYYTLREDLIEHLWEEYSNLGQ